MTIVFKVSDNVKKKMIDYYKDLSTGKDVPYSVFQATEGGTIITLYTSSKVVFQGLSADIDANLWIDQERFLNNRDINKEIENKENSKKEAKPDYRYFNKSTIGSDEVGTGDYFGPIVVTASFVNQDQVMFLSDLGVKDSKKLNDEKILKIAPTLIKKVPHYSIILSNKDYNLYDPKEFNMNRMKAILHNKAIVNLIKKDDYPYERIIIDQFVYPKKYFEHIKEAKEKATKITFMTHAEDVCLSVAVSSIISRYIFLKEMDKLSEALNMKLLKGASPKVDEQAQEIVNKYGFKKLNEIAKLNFKNTEKLKK